MKGVLSLKHEQAAANIKREQQQQQNSWKLEKIYDCRNFKIQEQSQKTELRKYPRKYYRGKK